MVILTVEGVGFSRFFQYIENMVMTGMMISGRTRDDGNEETRDDCEKELEIIGEGEGYLGPS